MPKDMFHDRERAEEAAYFSQQDAKLIEKLREKARLSEIAHALAEFANVDTPGDARIPQARGTYRELASTLRARADSIPYYTVWSSLKIVPTFAENDKASANLIGLSNIIGLQPERHDKNTLQRNIETALRLK